MMGNQNMLCLFPVELSVGSCLRETAEVDQIFMVNMCEGGQEGFRSVHWTGL